MLSLIICWSNDALLFANGVQLKPETYMESMALTGRNNDDDTNDS